MTLRPAEWDVLHPLDGHAIAIVRLVQLGPRGEPYYRAVSPEPERSLRRLIGYWGTVDEAHDGVLALYEHASGRSLSGGDRPPSRPLVPQKPPPGAAGHGSRQGGSAQQGAPAQPGAPAQQGAPAQRGASARQDSPAQRGMPARPRLHASRA